MTTKATKIGLFAVAVLAGLGVFFLIGVLFTSLEPLHGKEVILFFFLITLIAVFVADVIQTKIGKNKSG